MNETISFTKDRRFVLEAARDGAEIPPHLRPVALALEHPRRGLVAWTPGGSFRLTPEGAALLESWDAGRTRKKKTEGVVAPTNREENPA